MKIERKREIDKNYYNRNKEKRKEYNKKWRKDNPEKVKEWRKRYRDKSIKKYQESRYKVLSHYGGNPPKCCFCGYGDIRALCVDHINNDGSEDRKKIGSGRGFYRWIIRNNYPNNYQILCCNCNQVKEIARG